MGSQSVRVGDRTFTVDRGAGGGEGESEIPDKNSEKITDVMNMI